MGEKRDLDTLNYSDNDGPAPQPAVKRQRHRPSRGPLQPVTNITYGQKSAFPGLDGDALDSDDEFEYEDQGDAMSYLQSVRLESSKIPNLLAAPKVGPQLPPGLTSADHFCVASFSADGTDDSGGYYEDGAYIAAPDPAPDPFERSQLATDAAEDAELSRQQRLREAYYASLLSRFAALRQRLHRPPPPSALASLPRKHETEVGHFGSRSPTFRIWTDRLRYTDPLPAQIAAMDKGSALKLLRIILGGEFFRRGKELRERTSRWIWSLLARLPGRGEMDYAEMGWVRELGKRAVLMLISIAQMAALQEEVEEEDLDGRDGEETEQAREDDDLEDEDFLDALDSEEEEDRPRRPETSSVEDQHPTWESRNGYDEQGGGEADMDVEDGQVSDGPEPIDMEADIEAAKARLLAQLDQEGEEEEEEECREQAFDETRSRINARATLNMVLTVAGEFYGQRDLLEFRDPFVGVS